jgi:hypothetical protein
MKRYQTPDSNTKVTNDVLLTASIHIVNLLNNIGSYVSLQRHLEIRCGYQSKKLQNGVVHLTLSKTGHNVFQMASVDY